MLSLHLSMSLRAISLVLGSLILVGVGLRIGEGGRSSVVVQSHNEAETNSPLKAFALLLLSVSPTASWQSAVAGGGRAGVDNAASARAAVTQAGKRHSDSAMLFECYESQVAKQLKARGWKNVKVETRSRIIADGQEASWKMGTESSGANTETLHYEAQGLVRMADASAGMLVVPHPWLVGDLKGEGWLAGDLPRAFIVMDALKGARRGNFEKHTQRQLGLGLAAMHSAPPNYDWDPGLFGFPLDGCCGAYSQPNNAQRNKMNWLEFWIEFRLKHQLQGISDWEVQEMGEKIIKGLPKLFPFPVQEIQPSLLHGNLHSGNHGIDGKTGLPSVYNPASYYGHDEADFGIAHMFGGLSKDFYDGYFSVRPKKAGFEQRAILYELHHHLNHVHIMGEEAGGYLVGAKSLMRKLLIEMERLELDGTRSDDQLIMSSL